MMIETFEDRVPTIRTIFIVHPLETFHTHTFIALEKQISLPVLFKTILIQHHANHKPLPKSGLAMYFREGQGDADILRLDIFMNTQNMCKARFAQKLYDTTLL